MLMGWGHVWARDCLGRGIGWGPRSALLVGLLCQTCARCHVVRINEVFVAMLCPCLFEPLRLLGARQRVVARICVAAVVCNRLRIAQHKHKHSPWPLASFEYEWLAGGKSNL